MTVDAQPGLDKTAGVPVELVTLTIDGVEVSVPKGTLVIRAAELIGVEVPRFCDHPLLEPVGACRQCLVDVPDAGNGRGFPKPQASCTLEVAAGMVVKTQVTSPVAEKAQQGNLEFLLANHPLDCPVCDKGGECPLQNQAISHGRDESRFTDLKRHFAKPVAVSEQVLLDRERCVLCQRCTRFSEEIAGDPFIELLERGAKQQIGIAEGEPFHSYFSGNTIQICPVGALTSADYRFRARPFDLVSTPSITEHDSSGAAIRVDHRRGKVMRVLAGDDPYVNEEWISDKDRFAFAWSAQPDRLTAPLVRNAETGELEVMSWPGALAVAARGLAEANSVGVLPGGRLTLEDARAYASFARDVLGTDDIDYRSRVHSAEEAQFLQHWVLDMAHVGYQGDFERASTVVLAGIDLEDEAATVFLQMRKRARHGGRIVAIASHLSRGLAKLNAELIATAPGQEAEAIAALELDGDSILLVGERLAAVPGAFSSALAHLANPRIGWIPRRAGDRTAAEAGCLPNHGGTSGRDTTEILAAAASGKIGALVVGGVELSDLPDPATARQAFERAFVVSLEVRESEITALADVVLPVAPPVEKSGSYVGWDGNHRSFPRVLETSAVPDARVLRGIADELGKPLATVPSQGEAEHDFRAPTVETPTAPVLKSGQAVLSTWKQLIDDGRCQDGQPEYRATARPAVLKASAATLAEAGIEPGQTAVISSPVGSASFPAVVDDTMIDGVVWAPTNNGQHLGALGMHHGSVVTLGGES